MSEPTLAEDGRLLLPCGDVFEDTVEWNAQHRGVCSICLGNFGPACEWPTPRAHTCGDAGPWGTRCTEDPRHRYAHYDASDDSSWTDDVMREWIEDHPAIALPADSIHASSGAGEGS